MAERLKKGQPGQAESISNTPESDESRQEQDYGNEKKKTRGATRGHKGYGRKIPDNLPIREQVIDIAEDKKKCDCCGEALIEQPELDQISFEISLEKIYYIKKIVRKAYTKACDCPETRDIVVAPPPPKIIPKGKFSIEFWTECLLNKYMMHLPVQRQLLDMKLHNLPVSAGTIFGSFEKLHSLYLEPLYQAMATQLRKGSHWHADESRWFVFIELEGKDNHKWMMWCFASKDIVLFVLDPTRAAKVPCQTLFDINIEEF